MRVLVTGGAGFIGSHLVEALLRDGHAVTVFDSFDPYYPREAKERNLSGVRDRIQLVEGDIRDRARLDRALAGAEAVVHLAARAGVRPSIADPATYLSVNIQGTLRVLEAVRDAGGPPLINVSSSSVYGLLAEGPFREAGPLGTPASPYAASKRSAELLCRTFAHLHDLSITSLRLFTVFGPRQRPDMAIHKFARLVGEGQPVPLFGDGSSLRDYTYVDDVVRGIISAIHHAGGYRLYNLGRGRPVRLDGLVTALGAALGREVRVDRKPWQAGDVTLTWADIQRARDDLGYEPRVSMKEGLRRFVAWFEHT